MRTRFLAAPFAILAFVAASPARQVVGGPDPDRKASSVHVSSASFETLAAVSISHGQASWRESYDGMLETLKGSHYTRLGTGWWATFDTVGAVEVGGTTIEAGSYYLGLAVDREGAFSLLLFNSMQAMKAALLPGTTALYTGAAMPSARAPLVLARDSLKEAAIKLAIEITADPKDPATGKLSIRWGRHELSAAVRFQLATAKDVGSPKK